MGNWILDLSETDATQAAIVGGKAARLAALARIEGVDVPPGFCVTTRAFRRVVAAAPSIADDLERLARVPADDRAAIGALSARVRHGIEAIVLPDDLAAAIAAAFAWSGERAAWAVRSSATAEDLRTASFAGQQDSYLNIVGPAEILRHVSRCWASLFTERAVAYRQRHGFDHTQVDMAVLVQRMVFPDAAGVLFTADPVSGNRRIAVVEACYGLAESLVSGQANADAYTVRDDAVVARTIAVKPLAIRAAPAGGTCRQAIEPARQAGPALTDAQAVRLARLGRRIEAHFGAPQDIEWCLADDAFRIVQSRPITTLFPVPARDDGDNHVYVSVGHQQMMTDAMRPLGISIKQLTAAVPMHEAGGRLFVDVTRALASPASRAGLMGLLGRSDPLIGSALETLVERGDFVPSLPESPMRAAPAAPPPPLDTDPAIVAELIARDEASLAALRREIATRSGPALFDFILADIQALKRLLFDPLSHQAIMAGIEATWWLNDHLQAWLGEKNAADALAQSAPGNVTSRMGLALLEVADAIRPHPQVVAFLQRADGDDFLDRLAECEGGAQARDAIRAWLDAYGMRCAGEIDITNPRWSERPGTLVPALLGNVRNFAPGAAAQRFEQGLREASARERDLLTRLRALPDGEDKAARTRRMIDRLRTFIGYREYPKYGMVSRYFVYKQALLVEAGQLARAGVLGEPDDAFYLTFQEFHDAVRTRRVDAALIGRRRQAFRNCHALTLPRVLTSDGEVVAGAYRRDDLPAGALVGLAVSAGVVEGRARVVLDMAHADLDAGDILVTAYTDPSWTPLFVAIRGLVTEVGGVMTHGAVVAREYGLPAVVSVEHATRLIRDGQRIRVHGTAGYVEILE